MKSPAKKSVSASQKPIPDVLVANAGTVFAFCPLTTRAKGWIDENVQTESYQWLGNVLVVEHRYAWGLAEGMIDSGLVLQ
jgi:hypothetical protein